MLTLLDFYKLLRRIVQQYPEDDCKRLNTFAVVTRLNEALNQDNLGKIAQDYQNNMFWNRRWAEQGYPEAGISFELDGLIVRNVRANVDKKQLCHTLEIAVFSQADCDDCGCKRTPEEVDIANTSNLINVLATLDTYALYGNKWYTPGEVAYLVAHGQPIGNMPSCYFKSMVTGNGEISYSKQGAEGFQLASTVITFCGCNIGNVNWEYGVDYGEMSEPVKCSTC